MRQAPGARLSAIAILYLAMLWPQVLPGQQADWQQLHGQAGQLGQQNRFADMLPVALAAVRQAEATFGIAHPATAVSTYDVAVAYDGLHRDAEAETFFRRALTLEEKSLGPEHPEVAKCLNNLASLYSRNHRNAEAAPLLRRSIDLNFRSSQPSHAVAPLFNLAEIYKGEGKYSAAEDLFAQMLRLVEKDPAPDLALDFVLLRYAILYNTERKPAEAELLVRRALAIRERNYGPDKLETAEAVTALASIETNLGQYAQAEPLFRRALTIRERAHGPDALDVAETLEGLAMSYRFQNKNDDAEPLLRRTLAIREKTAGPADPDTVRCLDRLANLYRDQGQLARAEALFRRVLEARERTLPPDHPDVASSLAALGSFYVQQRRPADAIPLCKRWAGPDEKVAEALMCLGSAYLQQENFGESERVLRRAVQLFRAGGAGEAGHLSNALNSLAETYRGAGRLAEAEPLYTEAVRLATQVYGQESEDYANVINNLGLLYTDQGRYAEAEPLHKRSLAIMEKVRGPEALITSYPLNGLAALYQAEGRRNDAEPLLRRALRIREAAYGLDNPAVGTIVNNLAALYAGQQRFADAEPLQRRALAIDEKALGAEHPIVAIDLDNLGRVWLALGRAAEAEPLLQRSVRIVEKSLGPDHPGMITPLTSLAVLYYGRADYVKAAPVFDRALNAVEHQLQYQFTYMSEKNRLAFLGTVEDTFSQYFSFCMRFHDLDPALAGRMFDVALWQKGLVARSVTSLRAQIAASGDNQALAKLEELSSRKARFASLELAEMQRPLQSHAEVESLQKEINDLETDLVRSSAAFSDHARLSAVGWRDVAKALAKGEAAVEFVRFNVHDGTKWTGGEYAALLITPGISAPAIVSLGPAGVLEGLPLRDYRERVAKGPAPAESSGKVFFGSVWRPLEPLLGSSRRIYLSPDGILSEVSWAVIPSVDGRLLAERYDIRLVLSTRDLVSKVSLSSSKTAVLMGAPDFNLTEEARKKAVGNSPELLVRNRIAVGANPAGLRAAGAFLEPLDGTRRELESVQALLKQHSWNVDEYLSGDALEERIKALRSPRLLHVATHGFFAAEPQRQADGNSLAALADEPMLRSGIYLAGANLALAGKILGKEVDDGVLTAFEASGLNLKGTELVVLSACETGLGVTHNGEGVFGLRRALQEAGAEAVLMSLWRVPDKETAELMNLFYEKWLSGGDKQKALRDAQLEMRARVRARQDDQDVPFFWGAFVLVGR